MSFQIFDLFGDIRFEGMNEVMGQLTNLGSGLSNVGGAITQFGQTLINGITKPIVGLIEQGVKYNSTIEDLQSSFEVMLGSEEAAVNMTAKLKEMGAKTPFEVVGLAQATKTLLNYGYTQENVLPIMSRLGDVSLGNNERFQGLALVMGQVNSLGRLQAGDLNQLINRGWNPLNEITKRTGETTEQVRARMKDGKVTYKEVEQALTDATSAGGRFYGGMDKGSQTLSGKLSTLRDNFNEFLGSAVKPISEFLSNTLVPALTNLAGYFNNLSTPVKSMILIFAGVAAVIPVLIVAFGALITIIGGVITAAGVIGSVISAVGFVIPAVVVAVTALIGIFGALMLSSGSVRDKIKETFGGAVDKIKEAAMFIKNHISDIKNAITGFYEGIKTDNFEKFAKAMLNMFPNRAVDIGEIVIKFREFKETVINVRDAIMGFAKKVIEVITPLKDMFVKTFTSMDFGPAKTAFNDLKNSLGPLIELLKGLGIVIAGVWATVMGVFIGLYNGLLSMIPGVVTLITGLVGTVTSILGMLIGIITGDWDMVKKSTLDLWENVKNVFIGAFNAIVGLVSGFVNGIVTWFTSLYNTLVGHSIIPDMVNGIINWFMNLVNSVINFVSNLVSSVVNFFSSLAGNAKNLISGMVNTIINYFSNLVGQGRSLIQSLVNGVSSILNTLYSIAANAMSGLVNAISNYIGSAANAARNVASGIQSAISGIASSMYNAGANIIQSVINGIMSMVGKVKNAAGNIASAIKSFFPSSPAKEGPLQSIPKWMPTMINMITDDLEKGVDKVKKASLGVAKAISPVGAATTSGLTGLSKNITTQSSTTNNFSVKIDFDDINDVLKLKNFFNQLQVESVTRGGEA
jgi:tape measure domain-containing protein